LEILHNKVHDLRVTFKNQHLNSLKELIRYDTIINCSGLRAKDFVNNTTVYFRQDKLLLYEKSKFKHNCSFSKPSVIIQKDRTDILAYMIVHNNDIIVGRTSEVSENKFITNRVYESILKQVFTLKLRIDNNLQSIIKLLLTLTTIKE
jgi:hypothetical protein